MLVEYCLSKHPFTVDECPSTGMTNMLYDTTNPNGFLTDFDDPAPMLQGSGTCKQFFKNTTKSITLTSRFSGTFDLTGMELRLIGVNKLIITLMENTDEKYRYTVSIRS